MWDITELHRAIGNQAVGRLLQRKLVVNTPGDACEQEADRVADAVMRATPKSPPPALSRATPTPRALQRACSCGGTCDDCREEALERKEGSSIGIAGAGTAAPPIVHDVLRSPGQPLDAQTRAFMEPRFGRSFADARIHTDARAAESARAVGARAYTVGHDVVFGTGLFAPRTQAGQRLLAHELVHTGQQEPSSTRLQRQVDQAALEQCIAELGGSSPYRDGGLPSAEELDRYRRECEARLAPRAPSALDNLRRAWEYAKADLDQELIAAIDDLFTRQSLFAMAAFAALYVGAQLTPIGWVADAFALAALSLTVLFVGMAALEIARDLAKFFSVINATTEEERQASGQALARALARGAVGIVIALLTHAVGRSMPRGGPPGPPAAPQTVEVVAAGVGRVRTSFTTATAGEAVQASRIQRLAAYAVIVPPPGGTGPDAPSAGGRSEAPKPTSTAGLVRKIPYGEGPLSQLAQRLRLRFGLRRSGNVAVFEFESIPEGFRRLLERETRGVRPGEPLQTGNHLLEGNRLAIENAAGSQHSEIFADTLIRRARANAMELVVRRIYSEYSPCAGSGGCFRLITERYQNVPIEYSFDYDFPARESAARDAAVRDLFSGRSTGGGGAR